MGGDELLTLLPRKWKEKDEKACSRGRSCLVLSRCYEEKEEGNRRCFHAAELRSSAIALVPYPHGPKAYTRRSLTR